LIAQIAQQLQPIIEIEKAWLPPHAFAPNPSNPMESEMLPIDQVFRTVQVAPVDRRASIPEQINLMTLEHSSVEGSDHPLLLNPNAFHISAPFSSAKGTTSSDCAFAVVNFPQKMSVKLLIDRATINVAA
jgi:hypothetical protein